MQQAKKVSIDGVKRPRGRPPLASTLKRRMEEKKPSRLAAEPEKPPQPTTDAGKSAAGQTTVNTTANPPAPDRSPKQPPVVVKKRRKQGPRGMARLFVSRPKSKVNEAARQSFQPPPDTDSLSPPKHQVHETPATEFPKVGKLPEVCEQPTETASDQVIRVSSPIWQPASKRVLDAVCVTDVTACSGVTITVRESSIVDGFFRPQPEKP